MHACPGTCIHGLTLHTRRGSAIRAALSRSVWSPHALIPRPHPTAPQEHVHHTLSWVVRMITKRQAGGGLKVPPPILSRVYQELSNAYLAFNGAAKIAATPFPFPYAQVAVVQILVLMITIPIIVATFCADAPIFASGLTAVTVGGFHAIVEISYELEAPFSAHANAIPLKLMHDQFNRQLESLLQCASLSPSSSSFPTPLPPSPPLPSTPANMRHSTSV